jgi:hypothetical protein
LLHEEASSLAEARAHPDWTTPSEILSRLPIVLINLQMVSPLMEMMMQGSLAFRSISRKILLYLLLHDESGISVDSNLLELFSSFIPMFQNAWPDAESYLFFDQISFFIHTVDSQLLIDSNLFKDLLQIFHGRNDVADLFVRAWQHATNRHEDQFLQHLVEIGVFNALVHALHDETWSRVQQQEISRIESDVKETIRVVMMANQSCQEMVLMMEMPQSLRQELMRGMKRKRPRSS